MKYFATIVKWRILYKIHFSRWILFPWNSLWISPVFDNSLECLMFLPPNISKKLRNVSLLNVRFSVWILWKSRISMRMVQMLRSRKDEFRYSFFIFFIVFTISSFFSLFFPLVSLSYLSVAGIWKFSLSQCI